MAKFIALHIVELGAEDIGAEPSFDASPMSPLPGSRIAVNPS
jgi:hypothetical protein